MNLLISTKNGLQMFTIPVRLEFKIEKLVNKMLDNIPTYIWRSSTTTFLDPCMAGGQFCYEIERRLRSYGHSEENIAGRVFGWEANEQIIQFAVNSKRLIGKYSVVNVLNLKYNRNMDYDIIAGNPPYNATAGYKTLEDYKIVDGKHGEKRLYYFFTKLAIDVKKKNGYVMFVQPTCWKTSDDGQNLRQWLHNQKIKMTVLIPDCGGAFEGVGTTAEVQQFEDNAEGTESQFYGKYCIYTTKEWQRRWLDAVDEGLTMVANRGGFKEVEGLPLITTYDAYKRGVTTATRPVAPLKTDAERLIIAPQFVGSSPDFGNFSKSENVEVAPFSDRFIGIYTNTNDALNIMKWIRSDVFYTAMSWLKGSANGGSLCKYLITEEAYNKYVKETYEREANKV